MCVAWRQKGWEDARQGCGYTPLYEALNPLFQRAYEDGRLTLANVKLAGLVPPAWRRLGGEEYERYCKTISVAATLVGSVIPRNKE